ncbi:DUF222 domain-containing protein [Actinotalea sp. AC32]|nr:DUF222 domain-containing protein [Actinotalea sp. AC32]
MGTTTDGGTGGAHLAACLAALVAAVDALVDELDPEELDAAAAADLHVGLRRLVDRITGVAVRVLPVVEADGRWALDGARSFPVWLASRTGCSTAAARRDVRLGRALRDELLATAEAVTQGSVPLEHARVLATVAATSEARREALRDGTSACGERFLLDQATLLAVDPFRSLVRRWSAAADPDADERGFRDAVEREFLDVARTMGGYHLAGFLTEEHGQLLAAALASVAGTPSGDDTRTPSQRRAHALTSMTRTVLDHGLTGAGAAVRPYLSVHVDLDRLIPEAGPAGAEVPSATFDDGTPVPTTFLRRLACDSEVTRIVFGPASAVLDVGRSARTVTGPLRRAVIARDRHCSFPGCHEPPARCDVHHPHHWADGGVTSVDNAILLCWHHHDHVHRTEVTITPARRGVRADREPPDATGQDRRTSRRVAEGPPEASPTGQEPGPGSVAHGRTSAAAGRAVAPALGRSGWTFADRAGRSLTALRPARRRTNPTAATSREGSRSDRGRGP